MTKREIIWQDVNKVDNFSLCIKQHQHRKRDTRTELILSQDPFTFVKLSLSAFLTSEAWSSDFWEFKIIFREESSLTSARFQQSEKRFEFSQCHNQQTRSSFVYLRRYLCEFSMVNVLRFEGFPNFRMSPTQQRSFGVAVRMRQIYRVKDSMLNLQHVFKIPRPAF